MEKTQKPAANHIAGEAEAGAGSGRSLLQGALQLLPLRLGEPAQRGSHGHAGAWTTLLAT